MSTPCTICGCIDGEPSLCHAIWSLRLERAGIDKGRGNCFRVRPDLCSHCAQAQPGEEPELARHFLSRAWRADAAANLRGSSIPGAYQLRRHAARMRAAADFVCRSVTPPPTPSA
jgi:hypothetical protein